MTDELPETVQESEELEGTGTSPQLRRGAFHCVRCGVLAKQHWFALKAGSASRFSDSEDASYGTFMKAAGTWMASRCFSCNEFTVWRDERIMFPARCATVAVPHTDMPTQAKELYLEAREVIGISRRAGTALARASLESALKELDPMSGSPRLANRIEHALARTSDSLADMLTVIRYAGNESLHVGETDEDDVMTLVLDPAEEEIVEVIFESLNVLVEELVSKPARQASIYAGVPVHVKAKIEAAKAARKKAE